MKCLSNVVNKKDNQNQDILPLEQVDVQESEGYHPGHVEKRVPRRSRKGEARHVHTKEDPPESVVSLEKIREPSESPIESRTRLAGRAGRKWWDMHQRCNAPSKNATRPSSSQCWESICFQASGFLNE